jgi:DNA-binding transcriptional regulator YiaG
VARQLLPACRKPPVGKHIREGTTMDDNAGNLIRTLRQKLGMTQEEFAHEIAVTVSTVNRWENAHAEPSKLAWKAIHDLARKRGVTEDVVRRSGVLAESN